jgi:hypothetical protein
MTCKECLKLPPHYGARYDFDCIGCYARWINDSCTGKRSKWEAVKSNKRHDVEQLTEEVRKILEKK